MADPNRSAGATPTQPTPSVKPPNNSTKPD